MHKSTPTTKDAESAYAKATRAELAQDYNSAFQSYIKAAELFLHLSRTNTSDEKKKEKWKNDADKALQRAEKIKQFTDRLGGSRRISSTSTAGPHAESTPSISLTPVAIDPFSPQEQSYILKKGGSVNGLVVPLWEDSHRGDPRSVSCNPRLSATHEEMSACWRQPDDTEYSAILSTDISPQDISQNIIADCSVCSSISVCLEHAQRFGTNLASSILHPVSHEASNVYQLKIFFNGAWRRVRIPYYSRGVQIIDRYNIDHDRQPAPISPGSRHPSLFDLFATTPKASVMAYASRERGMPICFSHVNALTEQVSQYMKLMGGYDFPGSNSSIDIHTLTGWIPEHLDVKSPNFERESTWARLLDGFIKGRCMVTVGSGKYFHPDEGGLELLPSHSYAVIDMQDDGSERFITILDPWVRPSDSSLPIDQSSRTLVVPWSRAINVFEGIYLSWDPKIWPKTLTHHGWWRVNDGKTSSSHLRVKISSNLDTEIWVLLSRHVADTRKTSEFIALKVQLEDDAAGRSMVFGDDHTISKKVKYTNSPHVLTRVQVPASQLQSSGTLSVSACYEGASTVDVAYTATVYAGADAEIAWEQQPQGVVYRERLTGSLTTKNAGGNSTYPSFMINPQYHLHIRPPDNVVARSSKAHVTVTMEGNKELPMHIMIVWSQGQRIIEPSEKDIVVTSGRYSYGLARLAVKLAPGDYNIIVSTFEPHHTGEYNLNVASSLPFEISSILQEGAGMFSKTIRGLWNATTAAGAPSYGRYFRNPLFKFSLATQAKIQIRLQLDKPQSSTSLNVTIYPASQGLSPDRHVCTSGGYEDALSGVITPMTTLSKGKYWIIPSTYNPGVQTSFKLIVYSSVSVEPVQQLAQVT
ncbi:cysteine protease [Paramarasmius palmivorus]|uniref:Cysteine protease n=1 Tax=Paramarasmius palmivorus TaxID=297713 RepID=A0AAW0DNS9_9AGAR